MQVSKKQTASGFLGQALVYWIDLRFRENQVPCVSLELACDQRWLCELKPQSLDEELILLLLHRITFPPRGSELVRPRFKDIQVGSTNSRFDEGAKKRVLADFQYILTDLRYRLALPEIDDGIRFPLLRINILEWATDREAVVCQFVKTGPVAGDGPIDRFRREETKWVHVGRLGSVVI